MTNAELIAAIRGNDECNNCAIWKHGECNERKMSLAAADALEAAEKRIAELMPKEGVWQGIIIDGQYWAITCSNCHQVGFNAKTPYCPNCGARMKGANDAES